MLDTLADPRMLEIFWNEYGFLKWAELGLQGVSRRVTFRKSSLMGEIARYYSDDYIIWAPDAERTGQQIIESWRSADDVMSHRILLMGNSTWEKPLQKSFLMGFSGWVEVLSYHPGDPPPIRKFADLSTLVNNANVVFGQLRNGVNPVRERVVDFRKKGVTEGQPLKPAPLEVFKNLFRR